MNLRGLARELGQFLIDALGVLAEQRRKARRGGSVMLMRRVIEHGPENLSNYPAANAAAAEWGWSGEYVRRAARVAAWSPQLAARVAAGTYPPGLDGAAEAERAHRLRASWRERHPGTPLPLPGPDVPDDDLPPSDLFRRAIGDLSTSAQVTSWI